MLLIDKLRGDVMAQLKNELTDKKKYKKLIKELIVQVPGGHHRDSSG
jgi:hypothetical protein